MKRKKIIFVVAAIVFLGLGTSVRAFTLWSSKSKMSEWVRANFKEYIQPLPEPPFEFVLGSKPSPAQVELGRMLFNDPILSRNNDVSCATCHLTNHGFGDGLSLPFAALGRGGPTIENVGHHFGEGKLNLDRGQGDDGRGFEFVRPFFRNVPTSVNVVFRANPMTDEGLLLDGRFGRLTFQVLLPITQPEELCGNNPVPGEYSNLFKEGGPLFREPIVVENAHAFDSYTGDDLGFFNAPPATIAGVPSFRSTGRPTYPNRNECLAIAIAKLRAVPKYREMFKEAFGVDQIKDTEIGRAIASFLSTHASKDTPFDRFARGENALTEQQLLGFAIFATPAGETFQLNGREIKGGGCVACHTPPEFGGHGFASLSVVSDPRSALSIPKNLFDGLGKIAPTRAQRGLSPKCLIEGETARSGALYAPDIGRAVGSSKDEDCFKFRIPMLRNVIETYPYFHHGSERAMGSKETDFKKRSREALGNVIDYHLRGPVNVRYLNSSKIEDLYHDPTYQLDPQISYRFQTFQRKKDPNGVNPFPIKLDAEDREALLEFVAQGLFDPYSMERGFLGNDVSHPKKVPSGFPSLTFDDGSQDEMPPGAD